MTMIELTEKSIGVWFLVVSDESDYMAALELTNKGYLLTYRFRYYRGDQSKQFEESEDEKNWYRMRMEAMTTRDEAIAKTRFAVDKLRSIASTEDPDIKHPLFEVLNTGDFDAFVREFMQQDWTRAKWKDVKGVGPVEIREE